MNTEQYKEFFAAYKEIHALAYEYAELEQSLNKKLSGISLNDDDPAEYEAGSVTVPWNAYWGGATDYGSITIPIEILLGDKEKWEEWINNKIAYEAEVEKRKKEEKKKKAAEDKQREKEQAIIAAKELLRKEGIYNV